MESTSCRQTKWWRRDWRIRKRRGCWASRKEAPCFCLRALPMCRAGRPWSTSSLRSAATVTRLRTDWDSPAMTILRGVACERGSESTCISRGKKQFWLEVSASGGTKEGLHEKHGRQMFGRAFVRVQPELHKLWPEHHRHDPG